MQGDLKGSLCLGIFLMYQINEIYIFFNLVNSIIYKYNYYIIYASIEIHQL